MYSTKTSAVNDLDVPQNEMSNSSVCSIGPATKLLCVQVNTTSQIQLKFELCDYRLQPSFGQRNTTVVIMQQITLYDEIKKHRIWCLRISADMTISRKSHDEIITEKAQVVRVFRGRKLDFENTSK